MEFTYDGLDRRVRIVEKQSGTTVRDASFIWIGSAIAEERLSTGVANRFFAGSEEHDGVDRYLTRDHLGSIREVTDSTQTVLTRNEYDPYGRVSRVMGSVDSRFAFTGHYRHVESELLLSMHRAYDTALARWLAQDPIAFRSGEVNLYAYVSSNPVRFIDPLGLEVTNRSNRNVIIKTEDGPIGIVPPGQLYPGKVDGVLGPDGKWGKYSGKWWLPDNKIEVDKDGNPKCVGGLCKILKPEKLDEIPDQSWDVPKDPKPLPECKLI